MSNRLEILKLINKFAGTQERSDIEKALKKARAEYAKAQKEYYTSKAELSSLQERVDNADLHMAKARQAIMALTNHIQTMDLTGASAIRDRGEDSNYIIDGKEYYIDISDSDHIRKIPWKEYKKEVNNADDLQIKDPFDIDVI